LRPDNRQRSGLENGADEKSDYFCRLDVSLFQKDHVIIQENSIRFAFGKCCNHGLTGEHQGKRVIFQGDETKFVTSQKVLIKDEKYLDNINFVC